MFDIGIYCSMFDEETEGSTEGVQVMSKRESWLPLRKLLETYSVEMYLMSELIEEDGWG